MAFNAPTSPRQPSGGGWLWFCCRSCVNLVWRVTASVVVIAALAAGVLYLRLLQGPVELPGLAEVVEDQVNATTEETQINIGQVVVSLGDDGDYSGVEFRDVVIEDALGLPLLSVQRVGVELAIADLIHGDVQPQRILVYAPDATLTRTPYGSLRFAMGKGRGITVNRAGDGPEDAEDADVFEHFVDAMTGDRPAPELMEKLEKIEILGARLTFHDQVQDGRWSSQDARIELSRDETGARGSLSVAVIDGGQPGAAVRLRAERLRGAQDATLQADFGRITTGVMSGQLPELAWLSILEGTVEGRAQARIDRSGSVTELSGTLISENGRLAGVGPGSAYDVAVVRFSADPETGRVVLDHVGLAAKALDGRLTGVAELRLDETGAPQGLAAQLEIRGLELRLPQHFPDPLAFDAGQVNLRWDFDQQRIQIADTRLARGDLAFLIGARLQGSDDGWITDLHAEAVNMTVQDMLAHWPVAAATNARTWIRDNIPEASLDNFLAQVRFGDGEPRLALDFVYSGLSATYIDGMPPIERARGRGHMTYHALYLEMDEGWVTPPGGRAISLAGSSVDIEHFWGEVTPAFVDLQASGRTTDVLALIDRPPLRLVNKLGVELGRVGGDARVTTDLEFPLISDLRVEDVDADARAVLAGFTMNYDLRGKTLPVRAGRLVLEANTQRMRLQGPVLAAGAAVDLDWRENYGATPSTRQITLAGRTSPELLAAIGADTLPIDQALGFGVTLDQRGSGPLGFNVAADLTPARLEIKAAGWEKPSGAPGSLTARGVVGDTLEISAFSVSAGALKADGRLALTETGELSEARLDRFILPGIADVAGMVRIGQDGVPDIRLTRGSLHLSDVLSSEGDGSLGPAFRAELALDRVVVSTKIVFGQTKGRIEQRSDGSRSAAFDAQMAGGTSVSIAIEGSVGGRTQLRLATDDAGAVLRAADLYRGAQGGRLVLDAVVGGAGERDISGQATIDDLIVRSEATFRDVLRDGGLAEAQTQVQSGGIRFREVRIPFAYEDGVIVIEDAIASSPALALKINGTVNEETERMDMVGVMSPAYVLTGAINKIPVLGQILSGGEGEGILAMTFRLRGGMRDPDFSVNPLSILAPGLLRRVFSGRADDVDPGFAERINRTDRP